MRGFDIAGKAERGKCASGLDVIITRLEPMFE